MKLLPALAIISSSLLLASCGSSSTTSPSVTDASTTVYQGSGFYMTVPSAWQTVEEGALPTPKAGQIALALTSTEIKNGFANNLTVLTDEISESISAKKYISANFLLTTGKYAEVTKLDEKEITFADKEISELYVFEAKYNTQSTKQKFIQTARICSGKVYLLTIGVALDTTDTAKYETLAKSMGCGLSTDAK